MRPQTKVHVFIAFYYIAYSIVIAAILLGFIFSQYRGKLVALAVVLLLTTAFASLSKFAKKVDSLRRWKKCTKRDYDRYPMNEKAKDRAQKKVHEGIRVSGKSVLDKKLLLREYHHCGYDILKPIEQGKDLCMDKFLSWWQMAQDIERPLINDRTQQAWESPEAFLMHLCSQDAVLSVLFSSEAYA
jgi:hypothetical protein